MDDIETKERTAAEDAVDDKWDRLAGDPKFEAWLDRQTELALAEIEAGEVSDWLPGDPPE